MEQARPDSTLLPAAQIEAEHGSDGPKGRDERIAQLLTAHSTGPLPEPGSDEAKAAWHAACHEHSVRTAPLHNCPELTRSNGDVWTAKSLVRAMETGEITPADCAQLTLLATERELRFAEIENELNIGALFALAYAGDYPVAADEADPDADDEEPGTDAELLRLGRQFDAASGRETAANEACNAAGASQPHGEPIPKALDDAANEAGDIAADLAHRIAALPAQTAAGLRVKLRALAHYNSSFFYLTLPELPDPDQALSHSLWRDVQAGSADEASSVPDGSGTETDSVPAAVDLGPDRAIAELADKFCRVYRRHGEIDRAMMNGDITEEEWLPHHEAVMALARQLAETKPTTTIGMALKCLGPIGLLAWDGSVSDIPAQLSPHERVGAEFQAANRAGSLASILPDRSSEGTMTECQADRAWAVTQAAAIDLSGLTILELNNLYERFHGVADGWLAISSQPWARASADGQCHVSTAGGRIVDCEQDRAGEIRNRIAEEIRRRAPANDLERNMRLETLIQFELLCEISLRHNPELRAEIAQAWGA